MAISHSHETRNKMGQNIDAEMLELLGEWLRRMRKEMKLSLRQVSQQTEISIATLCRIERGEAKSLQSDKLLTLTEWMLSKTNFTKIEPLKKRASPVPRRRSPSRATPSPSRFLGPAAGDK